MSPTPAEQRIAAGYATSVPRQTRAEKVAAAFRSNDHLERLLRLEQSDPVAFVVVGWVYGHIPPGMPMEHRGGTAAAETDR